MKMGERLVVTEDYFGSFFTPGEEVIFARWDKVSPDTALVRKPSAMGELLYIHRDHIKRK